ncbi:MAG: Wadjet anti-phage system protein JetD domain-containing protein [Bacillota bacterium]
MRQLVEQYLASQPKKNIDTIELEGYVQSSLGENYLPAGGYHRLVQAVEELCREGVLAPVNSSGHNGRTPSLYRRYRKITAPRDTSHHQELLACHPRLSLAKYWNDPGAYLQDQQSIRALDRFFKDPVAASTLAGSYTVNERSFQIFRDEKFLSLPAGRNLLQQLGLGLTDLGCFETYEPFFYVDYGAAPEERRYLLVVENKDTFFTLKKVFACGKQTVNSMAVHLLVYGEGRKIVKSFGFLREIPGWERVEVEAYYFGDLDPEGIDIFGALARAYPQVPIRPFDYLYRELLYLHGAGAPPLRDKKQRLKAEHLSLFLRLLEPATASGVRALLDAGRYLPQEGLAYPFFAREVGLDA